MVTPAELEPCDWCAKRMHTELLTPVRETSGSALLCPACVDRLRLDAMEQSA